MTEAEAQKALALARDPQYLTVSGAHTPLQFADRLNFEGGRRVTMENVVGFLRWRAIDKKGGLDEEELESAVELLKTKRVVIVTPDRLLVLD